MPETRRQFTTSSGKGRCGFSGRPAGRSPRWPASSGSTPGGWGTGSPRTVPAGGDRPELSEDERVELVRLRKENTELRMQRDVLIGPVEGRVRAGRGRLVIC